jgi:CRP-like cAMP-binding protein
MNYESILKNVRKHISLEKTEIDYFTSLLSYKEIAKGQSILKEGQACRHINYVLNGSFRAYSFDLKGKESSIMFAIDDWWITDIHGFMMEKPALMNLESIEDSAIFQLQKSDLDKLFIKVPKFEKFFRILMQNSYIREQLRTRQNLTEPAEERYQNFVKKYPRFIERIPLKYIASYLGVTPQFLSVIRKRKRIN